MDELESEVVARIKLLHQVFEKMGVQFHGKIADEFLTRQRAVYAHEETDKKTGKVYTYSRLIKPVEISLTPLDFENSGYGNVDQQNLLDWLLYKNSSDNPLVWDNIGKPSQKILESFVKQREFSGPIKMNFKGQIFNGEDGNHRLLTLMLNQFLERTSAKTEEEKLAVDKKYQMTLPCNLVYNKELVDLLKKEEKPISAYSQNSPIPMLVRKYREEMLQHNWFVTYNPQTKIFNYELNGDKFTGSEEELINFLKLKKQIEQPIMTWTCDGVYYASCYNCVYKSKNKQKIDEIFNKLKTKYEEIENEPYLQVKDLDTNKYELQRDYSCFNEREVCKEIAEFEITWVNDNIKFLKNKTNYDFNKYLEDCDRVLHFDISHTLDPLKYSDLSKEELENLKEVFNEEDAEIKRIQEKYNVSV